MYLKYKRKVIRGLKYIIIILLTGVWIFYIVPVILVNIPYVQRKITAVAVEELSGRLGVPVQVERIDIDWLNRLVLENVSLNDQAGDPLFEANHVSAGFEWMPLLRGKIIFTTTRLFGFSLNLRKATPADPLNLQFVIDAFASRDTLKPSPEIDLRINTLLLRKGHITYHIASEDPTPQKFNPAHVDVRNISANLSLKAFNKDSINANVKRLSFEESSGFKLDRFSMNLIGNHDSAYIDNFEVRLPQTRIHINRAAMDISAVDGISSFLNNAPLELSIAPSQINLRELSPFIPAFAHFNDTIQLVAQATGTINHINLQKLTIRQSNKLFFSGMMDMRGITSPGEAYLFGKVNQLHATTEGIRDLVNNFSSLPVKLPDAITRLGTVNFTGEISGFFDNLVAFGKFNTSVGSIQTDLIFGHNREKHIDAYLSGHISTSNLAIDRLFETGNPYGNARFQVKLDATKPAGGQFAGAIEGDIEQVEYKKYLYENIRLAGHFQPNGFNGYVQMDDPNGHVYAEGMIRNEGQHSIFNFMADVRQLRPDKLFLTDIYDSPELSFSLHADFTGNTIDNVEGTLRLDSLAFTTLPDSFYLQKMEITASGRDEERKLTIASDLLNGEIDGAYSFSTIYPSLFRTLDLYLPSVAKITQDQSPVKENNFSLLLTLGNTETLSNTLKLPFTNLTPSRITGHYNNRYNKFRVEAFMPRFKLGGSTFEGGVFTCENPGEKVTLSLTAANYNTKGLRNHIQLTADAQDNRINSLLSWHNNKERQFKADLLASAFFANDTDERGNSSLRTEISVNNSALILNDTLWQIEPAAITLSHGKVNIDHFHVSNGHQYATINGVVSSDPLDTLNLDLNEIELSYIFETLNIPVLQFGGRATGTFHLSDLYGSRMLNTDLEVQNFSFNKIDLGRLNLYSEWDDAQRGILMLGTVYKNDSTWTDVSGYIFPVKPNEGLSLYFDANDINIAFLQPFLAQVVSNVQGHGFGQVHLFGPFKELTVEGKAYVENAGMGVDFLNTYYTFSDSVLLTPSAVVLNNVAVHDKFGNTGRASLQFNHKHFKEYNFDARFHSNNMLVYDQSQRNSPLIYGTVFGSGSVDISGNKNLVNFDINMQSGPKTSIGFNFMTNTASDEYSFITFVDKSRATGIDSLLNGGNGGAQTSFPTEEGAELRMNFLVDITPDATIELIMDPASGDRIKGNASGSMRVEYGNKTDLRMYGNVEIVDGSYNFSLQQLIHRDFKIREGSTINFNGDPFNANMRVNAIYNLTANLGDLDQELLRESSRANIPVNCVLNLDGMLRNPAISFAIELPSSNEELQRQVRSFIDTEDMMTRQVVYLLVLNKFYTPDYTSNTGQNRSGEFSAAASSAISSQLSSILNSITDKVQIGTNIRTGQAGFAEDTEVEMLLSSQMLDNRLLFNGNFGYRNSLMQQRNVFVGEFDLEYKLTPAGDIRLKAYNHANDMYQSFKQSLTTQGVGILFKKDFSHFFDLFMRKRRLTVPAPNDNIPYEDRRPGQW